MSMNRIGPDKVLFCCQSLFLILNHFKTELLLESLLSSYIMFSDFNIRRKDLPDRNSVQLRSMLKYYVKLLIFCRTNILPLQKTPPLPSLEHPCFYTFLLS